MEEQKRFPPKESEQKGDPMRSPVRPPRPEDASSVPKEAQDASVPPSSVEQAATTSLSALGAIRQKMEVIADEFASGKLNRAQFYALYRRYSEQRTIIERLVERNPDSHAWKQVMTPGQTGFLRTYFAAQILYFVIYRNLERRPILTAGVEPADVPLLDPILNMVWKIENPPKQGLGRRQLGERKWLILAVGGQSTTAVVWSTEPSIAQARLVKDLHADFERANQTALKRGWIAPDKMVFPQRALLDQKR